LLPAFAFVLQALNLVFDLAILTVFFAMMFKFLPQASIKWGDVWVGAGLTAVLFAIGAVSGTGRRVAYWVSTTADGASRLRCVSLVRRIYLPPIPQTAAEQSTRPTPTPPSQPTAPWVLQPQSGVKRT